MNNLPRFLYLLSLLTGCAAIIGVPDLAFDPDSPQGQPDASTDGAAGDGNPSGTDAGDPAPPCDETKLQTDPNHCGRCGHSCIGGECKAGTCAAVLLAAVPNAPLGHIVEHGSAIYVSTATIDGSKEHGLWKVDKTPGTAVRYVPQRNARSMRIIGDTLYFIAYDYAFNDAGAEGGLYACDLNGPTPCVPKLLGAASSPYAMALDQNSILYTDAVEGIMKYTPPGPPIVFRPGYEPHEMWVDGEGVYYLVTPGTATNNGAILLDLYPDAGGANELSRWTSTDNGINGELAGTAKALYYSAYTEKSPPGGVVRRVARPGAVGVGPCDYGGTTNKRPSGLYLDTTRIFWANQGEPTEPYASGSIASCELGTCCTEATTHWTGDGEPNDITGDDSGLYWVTYRKGEVWKVAKP